MKAQDYDRPEYEKRDGTHTLRLYLDAGKTERDVLYKRFGIEGHIQNVIIKHAMRLIDEINSDDEYKELKAKIAELKKSLPEDEFDKAKKPVVDRMNDIRIRAGLTKDGLEKYAKVQGRLFKKNISSQQVQVISSRVWSGVEKVLFSDGKKLHFKPYREIDTICGKSPTNGTKFFSRYHNYLNEEDEVLYPDGQITWCGLTVPVKIDYDDPYVCESLQHNVKYCEIKRMMFMSGYRYYVILYLDGPAPKKIKPGDAPLCEIDPGVSTMAVYSKDKIILRELAPEAKSYQKKICKLQREIDDCKRRMNPENYNENGTVKKGKHTWKLSKTAKCKQREVTVLYRKEAASRLCSHNKLANDIIKISPDIRLEPMDYSALQKRSKKTEKQDKESEVKTRSGDTKTVRKNKRKKRFGTSCRTRAPARFIDILESKALKYGGSIAYIDTRAVKPSQYDHVSKEFVKTDLRTRSKVIGGHEVQRDLYSAFLGYCVGPDGKTFDHDKAEALFDKFVIAQNEEISFMKQKGISMPHCFGF